jgi:hypothetical protein
VNSYKQSLFVGAIRIAANVLMVAAVFLAMYMASRGTMTAELGFCLWFFATAGPIWLVAFLLTRFVRRRFPAEYESFVELPKVGRQLVRWQVAQSPRTRLTPH